MMLGVCLSIEGKFQSDQYARLKQNCANRCQTKGYFQDLCTKICISPQCYYKIYQKDENKANYAL
jgi:hypothetical protein